MNTPGRHAEPRPHHEREHAFPREIKGEAHGGADHDGPGELVHVDVPRDRHRVEDAVELAVFLPRYDRPGTLFYLDPPYWGSEGFYGKHVFGRDDFDRLARALRGLKGRSLMSINDHPAVRALFSDFAMEGVGVIYGVAGGATEARELIIGN